MAYTLNENLKRWAEQYETAEFVKNDPVQIPRRYDSRVNIEISAFVTAWIAWGNRKQIIKKADFIDREIFHGSPVDFGLWTICDPRNLIIPLDTHVHKQALRLGLVKRRTPDLQTAIEITDRFAEIFPDDPTKGDFALFGYGVNNGKVAPVTAEPELEKEQPTAVADLSIADVLKMQLFYDNAAAEVREIWESREKARKELKATERLKAHPIDGLHNAGLLEPGEFVVTFAKVLDKRETKLSRAERDVIHIIGMTAFNKTMQKLIADEKARNNSDGNNKQ